MNVVAGAMTFVAAERLVCQRPDCENSHVIRKGEKYQFVGGIGGEKRLVCQDCYVYYLTKAGTSVEPERMPNREGIERAQNAAQREGSRANVTRIGSMGPPPQIPLHAQLAEERRKALPSGSSGARGYTAAHSQYEAHHKMRARMAYAPIHESMNVNVSVKYFVPGKAGATLLGNVQDVFSDIPANITPLKVKEVLFDGLRTRIERATKGYRLDIDDVELRGDKMADLERTPNEPVFYQKCFKRQKNGEFKFSHNCQQTVTLVIPAETYAMIQEHMYAVAEAEAGPMPSRKRAPSPAGSDDFQPSETDSSPPPRRPGTRPNTRGNKRALDGTEQSTASNKRVKAAEPPVKRAAMPVRASTIRTTQAAESAAKAQAQASTSTQRVRTATAGPSQVRNSSFLPSAPAATLQADTAPRDEDVRGALMVSRPSAVVQDTNQYTENCQFLPIPFREFDDLVKSKTTLRLDWHADSVQGILRLDERHLKMLGPPGSFKTAHPALLTLQELVPGWTGAAQEAFPVAERVSVAAKRWFERNGPDGGRVRLSPKQESAKLATEANALMWANALMRMCYDVILKRVEKSKDTAPIQQLPMPFLRYVFGGLVRICHSQEDYPRQHCTYLIEELIDTNEDNDESFVKYISNSSAVPIPHRGKRGENATFLSFIQHLTYEKTNGLAYISDYQGNSKLLTDPQIMTHPDLGDLFGAGNLRRAFAEFPSQHPCNVYCEAFGLSPLNETRLASKRPTKAKENEAPASAHQQHTPSAPVSSPLPPTPTVLHTPPEKVQATNKPVSPLTPLDEQGVGMVEL